MIIFATCLVIVLGVNAVGAAILAIIDGLALLVLLIVAAVIALVVLVVTGVYIIPVIATYYIYLWKAGEEPSLLVYIIVGIVWTGLIAHFIKREIMTLKKAIKETIDEDSTEE